MSETPQNSDVAFIQSLAELLRQNDLAEIRVKREYGEDDSLDVRVSRILPQRAAPAAPAAAPAALAAPASAPAAPDAEPNPASDPATQPGVVTSPMVGTVYMAPEPGAPNFVSVGEKVKEGQTILIVEAMKTMNQIPAPRSGTVTRLMVEDGAPVEFGAPLIAIE